MRALPIPQDGRAADAGPMKPIPGHTALRSGRCSLPQQIYLVTATTAGRQPLFAQWPSACAACRTLIQPVLWRGSRLLCWTLMPDHWHALLQVGDADTLSGVVNRVKSSVARAVNATLQRKGQLWAKSFHDHALRSEEDLLQVARYVVANPMRAGLVRSVRDYPFWDAVWLTTATGVDCSEPLRERHHDDALDAAAAGSSHAMTP